MRPSSFSQNLTWFGKIPEYFFDLFWESLGLLGSSQTLQTSNSPVYKQSLLSEPGKLEHPRACTTPPPVLLSIYCSAFWVCPTLPPAPLCISNSCRLSKIKVDATSYPAYMSTVSLTCPLQSHFCKHTSYCSCFISPLIFFFFFLVVR